MVLFVSTHILDLSSYLHERIKHIEIDCHFFQGKVAKGLIITPSLLLSFSQHNQPTKKTFSTALEEITQSFSITSHNGQFLHISNILRFKFIHIILHLQDSSIYAQVTLHNLCTNIQLFPNFEFLTKNLFNITEKYVSLKSSSFIFLCLNRYITMSSSHGLLVLP